MSGPLDNLAPLRLARALAGPPVPGLLLNPRAALDLIDPRGTSITAAQQSKISAATKQPASNQFTKIPRTPFALTCQSWIQQRKFILYAANPTDIQWHLGLRASNQKTQSGTVQHVWRTIQGKRKSFFDEPEITINFQSGNLMPLPSTGGPGSGSPGMPLGMGNFIDFLDLLNQPRILNDAASNRRANLVYIMYNSVLFPQMVLAGQFTPDGVTFNDSADDANQVKWTSSFTVYSSYPAFESPDQLKNAFSSAGFGRIGS